MVGQANLYSPGEAFTDCTSGIPFSINYSSTGNHKHKTFKSTSRCACCLVEHPSMLKLLCHSTWLGQ